MNVNHLSKKKHFVLCFIIPFLLLINNQLVMGNYNNQTFPYMKGIYDDEINNSIGGDGLKKDPNSEYLEYLENAQIDEINLIYGLGEYTEGYIKDGVFCLIIFSLFYVFYLFYRKKEKRIP